MGSAQSKPTVTDSLNEKEQLGHASSQLENLSLSERKPESADGSLALSTVSRWQKSASADPRLRLARTVFAHSDFKNALVAPEAKVADPHVFNTSIEFSTGPVTNQKSSGRCWLFATTNVLRFAVQKNLNIKEFQLSQSFLFFWDKLNKSNYFLENMIDLADTPLDDRLVSALLGDIASDGGQWDMAVNLLDTYGIVPQAIFPETYSSSNSGSLNTLNKTKLREHALTLRNLASSLKQQNISEDTIRETLRARKEALMSEIFALLSTTLGVPPKPDEKFSWDYIDANGKAKHWEGTPVEFYKSFAYKQYSPADSFSLINDPRNPYDHLYTVDRLGNIWGGRPVLYVNTQSDRLKQAVVKMVKAGHPVFFGCDVGKWSDRSGIMDYDLFEFEDAFNFSLKLTKAQRLQSGESTMTHAMVISAVHVDPSGKPIRYRVENSWGEDAGEKGYYVMTDAWFDEFVYQVVIPKALAPKDLLKVYESGDKTVFPIWDPMARDIFVVYNPLN